MLPGLQYGGRDQAGGAGQLVPPGRTFSKPTKKSFKKHKMIIREGGRTTKIKNSFFIKGKIDEKNMEH